MHPGLSSVFIQKQWLILAVSHWCHWMCCGRAALPVLIPQGYPSGFVSEVWQVHLPCCVSGGIWRVRKCHQREHCCSTGHLNTDTAFQVSGGFLSILTTVNQKKVFEQSRAELLCSLSWISCDMARCAWGSWTVLIHVWNSYHWKIAFLWPTVVTCRPV